MAQSGADLYTTEAEPDPNSVEDDSLMKLRLIVSGKWNLCPI